MAESISQRLASDTVKLVSNDRMEVPRRTFHHQAEGRGVLRSQFVPQRLHRLRQVIRNHCRRA